MRKVLSLLLFISSLSAMAQAPNKMNYQAVARNSSGAILASTNLCLNFTITNGSGGPTVYSELNQSVTTNQFGLFTWAIGSVNAAAFGAVDWSHITPWLQVDMKVNCTGSFVSMGTSQLLSVPYSMRAAKSEDNLWADSSGNTITIDTVRKVGIGVMVPSYKLDVYSNSSANALRLNSLNSTTIMLQSGGQDHLAIKTAGNKTYFTNVRGEDFVFQDSTNTEIMRLKKSNHSVGIGTTSPLQMLEVAGGIRIGDATNSIVGSMRYNTNDFQGYTPNGWESFLNHPYQSLQNYFLTSSTRNALVYSNDSLVVSKTGIYVITMNVKGSNANQYNAASPDYDQNGFAEIYKVGSGPLGGQPTLFVSTQDNGSAINYYRYIGEFSSITTIQYLVAGDVLKVAAFVSSTGNPTGNWSLDYYQIQIIKIGNL